MNDISIADRMMQCTIANDYDGLDDLKKMVGENAEKAWQIIWDVLNKEEDPGKDDGALCFELLKIAADHLGRDLVEGRIEREWGFLPDQIQRNLINGFASDKVISDATIINLFNLPATATRQRHLIVAMLASCRRKDTSKVVLELASRIGRYREEEQQARLDFFLKSLVENIP